MCESKAEFQIDFIDDEGHPRKTMFGTTWLPKDDADLQRRVAVITDGMKRLGCEIIQIAKIQSAPIALDLPERRATPRLTVVQPVEPVQAVRAA